ncbi:MAG: hypothetical protein IJM30_12595 [Thermoguttaceae bacterium]|nr:hypothetical protein [Thermoguttaceae bacterium]
MRAKSALVAVLSLAALCGIAHVYNRTFLNAPKWEPRDDREEVADPAERVDLIETRAPELSSLFPNPNDWRRQTANFIFPEGREYFFLFKGSPVISSDRKTVSLGACSFVYLGEREPEQSDEERANKAFVFESTDRIELTFSETLDRTFKLGSEKSEFNFDKFAEGRAFGEVVIRTKIGDVDALLRTRDVTFNETQIVSKSDVSFHIGSSSGEGRGFAIVFDSPRNLASTARRAARGEVEPGASPAERIEALERSGNLGGGFSLKSAVINELKGGISFRLADLSEGAGADNATAREDSRFEARCKGGVFFNSNPNEPGGWVVRLNESVELVEFKDGTRSNQLLCDRFYLYMQDPNVKALANESAEIAEAILRKRISGSPKDLRASNLRAIGGEEERALIRNFASGVEILADEIVYDLEDRVAYLDSDDDGNPAQIKSGSQNSEANFFSKNIELRLNENDEIERIVAQKDGELIVDSKDKTGEPVRSRATWKGALVAVPTAEPKGYFKLSSYGPFSFSSDALGTMTANEAEIVFKPIPKESSNSENRAEGAAERGESEFNFAPDSIEGLRPVLASFRNNVSLRFPRGEARVANAANVRFESIEETEEETAEDEALGRFESEGDNASLDSLAGGSKSSVDDSRFEISGRELEVRCVLRWAKGRPEPKARVVKLALSGDASFCERLALGGAEKTVVKAGSAQIDNPGSETTKLRLHGSSDAPALFKTENLTLTGGDISVDAANNRFEAIGSGSLEIASPVARAEPRIATSDKPEEDLARFLSDDPIKVEWSRAMRFDGQKLSFLAERDKSVLVSQGTQTLKSPEVDLTLKNPTSIFKLNVKDREAMEVATVECVGNNEKFVEIDVVDKPKEGSKDAREGVYRVALRNLRYDVAAGTFSATDGGEFYGIVPTSRDASDALARRTGGSVESNRAVEPSATSPKWTKIWARFKGNATGSIAGRETTFSDGIKALAATVENPNEALDFDSLDDCPASTASIESQEASVKLIPGDEREGGGQDLEIEARRNVLFRQKTVAGTCEALRYASKKGVVVLAGSPTTKAALYKQEYQGARRETLGEFSRAIYWLDTGKFEIEALDSSR